MGLARAFLQQALELSEIVAEGLGDYEPAWPTRDPRNVAIALLMHDRQHEDRNTLTISKFLDGEHWAEVVRLEPLFLVVQAYEQLRQQVDRTIEYP